MQSKTLDRESFKKAYEAWGDSYVGYIQISDTPFESEHIWTSPKPLPKWDDLHNTFNYILELCLYNKQTRHSIVARQHNDSWLVLEKQLNDDDLANTENFETVVKETPRMRIAQIWQEESDPFCEGWKVLEPKALMFAGFEQSKGEKL